MRYHTYVDHLEKGRYNKQVTKTSKTGLTGVVRDQVHARTCTSRQPILPEGNISLYAPLAYQY